MADSDVTVTLNSTPVLLGVARTGSNGAFVKTFNIPSSAELGLHSVVQFKQRCFCVCRFSNGIGISVGCAQEKKAYRIRQLEDSSE